MSIAAVSSALVARVAAASPVGSGRPSEHAEPQSRPAGGRRHELVDAMVGALDLGDAAGDRHAEQAVFRFAHALLHDLRKVGGDAESMPRRDWSALGPRLEALATAARSGGDVVPAEPSPLTATTAALHVMQVPSSRLIEAFQTLREAVPTLASDGGDARTQLAAFLDQLAGTTPVDAVDTVAGALLHTTA